MTTKSIDFSYVEVEYELWAVRHLLDVIEPAIDYLSTQDEEHTMQELRRQGVASDDADVDLAFQDLAEKRTYVLPRLLRGPALVALWSCYESSVQAVAHHLALTHEQTLRLSDLRGDFLTRARKYSHAILRVPVELDETRYRRLGEYYWVRNTFAHANGVREWMRPGAWEETMRALGADNQLLDMERGLVLLSKEYLDGAFEDISRSIRDFVVRAKAPK